MRKPGTRPVFFSMMLAATALLLILGFEVAGHLGTSPSRRSDHRRPHRRHRYRRPRGACGERYQPSLQLRAAAIDGLHPDLGAPTESLPPRRSPSAGQVLRSQGRAAACLQFDLRLPVSTWAGDYVQEGCGGYCGAVTPGAPTLSTNCPAVTGNELALATDNEGHVGANAFDALWAADDPAMRISYAYTSEHNLDLAAKAIIAAYYGRAPPTPTSTGAPTAGAKRWSRRSATRTTSTASWPARRRSTPASSTARYRRGTS